jgi:hypothetical protein
MLKERGGGVKRFDKKFVGKGLGRSGDDEDERGRERSAG